MPRYIVDIMADREGIPRRIEYDAATPWLALEKTQKQYGWHSAELFDRDRSLGKVDALGDATPGFWQILPRISPTLK